MPGHRDEASEVLDFWFMQSKPHQWFTKDPAFEALLQPSFLGLPRRAIAGEPQALALSPKAVELGWLEAEPEQARRTFRLMPLRTPVSQGRNAQTGTPPEPSQLHPVDDA